MDYAVIMAGGSGKRLWPLSREKRPKQVLKLISGHTLLQQCFQNLLGLFDQRNIIVLTNEGYVDVIRENLSQLLPANVIAEPVVRDTAGAIGLAAAILTKYDAEATMVILTADHIIRPVQVLQKALKDAITFVNTNPDSMITFGIAPSFPSTQLGYIKTGTAVKCPKCKNEVVTVEAYKEKPDEKTAKHYVDSGQYLWNSGMFVWKAKTVLDSIAKHLPQAIEPLQKIKAAWDTPIQEQTLKECFPRLPKISIDYAIMEKAEKVFAIKLDCHWLDMGSFTALADIIQSDEHNNIVAAGAAQLLDCRDNIIVTEDPRHLIAAIGIKDIVIAHSHDATLICHIDQTAKIKDLLELIKKNVGEKYL